MKLYPTNLEQKINFDKIRELIREECSSTLGTDFVQKISFSRDAPLIQRLLDQTEEFKRLLLSGETFPSSNFVNIHPYLDKARLEGAFLYEEEFHEISLGLQTLSACVDFFNYYAEDYPQLFALLGMVNDDRTLVKAIERVLDERGKIKNNASPELAIIRNQLLYEENRLRKVLDSIFRQAKAQGLTPEDASITIRGGRMVMPVLAEYKRRIKGFIHDESATGQTVFMEPAEVLDINNEIRDLEYMERREVQKILTKLTDILRAFIPDLRKAFHFLGLVDFIRAKAKFAIKIRANKPLLEKTKQIRWTKARHPLLELSLKAQQKQIVPIDVSVDHNKRILLISGPNAGGKSVALKTVALLQYMFQCGILIPVEEESVCGVFDQFFIDIGDEQSLENDLSTYSSHLNNMKHFTRFANKRTIFFIDEFGTGTEPQFGGAIAEGILIALNKSGAFGVITTHYGNLKQLAAKGQGLFNGAMRYDVEKLEPLYQLELGKPGSSFAFEIARKIGIDEEIILHAKAQVGEVRVNYDKMLLKLESEKNRYEQVLIENEKKEKLLNKRLEEYNALKSTLEVSKKTIINEAKVQAKALLDEANRRIESTIREIKEKNADKEKTKQIRKELEAHKEAIKPEKTKIPQPPKEVKVLEGEIKEGDHVRLKDNGAIAEVISVQQRFAEISIGDLKSKVKLNRLERISNTAVKKEKKSYVRSSGFDSHSRMLEFSPNLDLRGKRGEEIFPLVQHFVDDGHMFGQSELRIVHGKGDGILRDLCRNILRNMPAVSRFEDEHVERGGAGVTLVYLKSS
ncbi:Recombination inhibitory protein MutS2 [Lunatimonas lonarensis]|uniref:Endonuclease MutS2 n=1 Tax=Lunatimonas lonarensis TaxID=1232681 RepID=R7ZQ91_9BACT|nr:Smr/MutS family protein [Lunatimonas lonarensis]EON76252.1 Recombination inhibitory protein MutS2 [Lunatimonas lonarensis]